MAKRRVMFLINSLTGGGAERVMTVLMAYSRYRLEDTDFSLTLLDDEDIKYAPPEWLPLHQLDTHGSMAKGFSALLRHVREQKPDLILSFLTRSNILAIGVGKMLRIPVVISERVNTSTHLRDQALARLMVRMAYPFADHVIPVSSGVEDDLVANYGLKPQKITTINNPVDVSGLRRRAEESFAYADKKPYILSIGRLTPTKNPALLIDMMRLADIPQKLLILGEGPERERIEKMICEYELQDKVELLGFVDNPFPILANAEIFVSPSNSEGFPNALCEALALGIPCVATNCASGPSDVLADRRREDVEGSLACSTGILVPTEDTEAMARAVENILSYEDNLAQMKVAARARAIDLDVPKAVGCYWEVIDAQIDR